jgi:diaminohydroxyphosphoribosylaminopyrimidine deaminase/5-amino-6-(5-phosphoribosylamino)uracil reductase
VVGCADPFAQVAGRGIQKMEAAGIKVSLSKLADEARALNKRFFTFHQEQRPYVVLKWAQSANGMIGAGLQPVRISNDQTNRVVHKWRTEEHAIMVGTNTAALDTPSLTARLYPGRNPKRILIDRLLRVAPTGPLFDGATETIVLNTVRNEAKEGVTYVKLEEEGVAAMLWALHGLNVQSVLVEGGAQLLRSFIDSGLWDEARIITASHRIIEGGVPAPVLRTGLHVETALFDTDSIHTFRNDQH